MFVKFVSTYLMFVKKALSYNHYFLKEIHSCSTRIQITSTTVLGVQLLVTKFYNLVLLCMEFSTSVLQSVYLPVLQIFKAWNTEQD